MSPGVQGNPNPKLMFIVCMFVRWGKSYLRFGPLFFRRDPSSHAKQTKIKMNDIVSPKLAATIPKLLSCGGKLPPLPPPPGFHVSGY